MVQLPENKNTLLSQINAAIASQQEDSRRRHLGASQIGHPCQRHLWYSFRWVKRVYHEARLLRLFARGQLEEARFEAWLKLAGVNFQPVDPVTGKQFRVRFAAGHFGGSCDGIGDNVPEAPKTLHLFEFKTHSDDSFKKLQKNGMRSAKPEHYAQMQIYMNGLELTRGVYMAINKNTDELYVERVNVDSAHAYMMIQKAEQIVTATEPPLGIGKNQERMECKWCEFNAICAGMEKAEKNCRTCIHASPVEGGNWHCARYNVQVNPQPGSNGPEHDRDGCGSYEIIPALNLG